MFEDMKAINKRLDDTYGRSPHGFPWFRLVFSDHELEQRDGTREVYAGPVYLRTETGPALCKKYTYLKDQFVLEKFYYHDEKIELEVQPAAEGVRATYEAIWAFPNKDGQPVLPSWGALQMLIYVMLHGRPMTKAEHEAENEQQERAEVEEFKMLLAESRTDFSSYKEAGELIIRP